MLDWIYPQVVETVDSPINGPIKILKLRGQYSAWVGGFEQSGSFYVQKIWKKKLDEIKTDIKSGLVLGLGCGTVAKLLSDRWPDMAIVGVEIDPVMIGLGKKYFGLGEIPGLTILRADAYSCINTLIRGRRKFDLVLVDLYFGGQDQGSTEQFISKVFKVLAGGGQVIYNQLVLRGRRSSDNSWLYFHRPRPRARTRRNRL